MVNLESLESEIAQWRASPSVEVSISSIKTAEGLQPRNPRATRANEAARAEAEAGKHVDRLKEKLADDPLFHLEPILGAVVDDGSLYVVDGHHRVKAYRRAGRCTVPVRKMVTTLERAALLSRLVNLDGVKLPMTAGQCAEAAWQYLATVTGRGRLPLKDVGLSTRKVASKFGVSSHQTVATMWKRMEATREAADAGHFHHSWCDPVTGWPNWRYARGQGGQNWRDIPLDVVEQAKLERCAKKIAKLHEEFGMELYRRAEELLRIEGDADAV